MDVGAGGDFRHGATSCQCERGETFSKIFTIELAARMAVNTPLCVLGDNFRPNADQARFLVTRGSKDDRVKTGGNRVSSREIKGCRSGSQACLLKLGQQKNKGKSLNSAVKKGMPVMMHARAPMRSRLKGWHVALT